jgi:hypothetical protein
MPKGTAPYLLRDDFLSPAEFSFFRVLQFVVGDRGIVCPKVNLGDIFFVSRAADSQKYRNKIDRKHVDFLVCHPVTMKPLFGVELDDKSHRQSERVERDALVDQVFQAAGLPLVRQPARSAYDPNALAAELAPCLAGRGDGAAAMPPAREAVVNISSPVCPKCGVAMVERIASKGQNKGNAFWGCPNYPRCRETAS